MVSFILKLRIDIHRTPLGKVNQYAQIFIGVLSTQKALKEHICLMTWDNPTVLPCFSTSH